jgi:curli biogenesis system outer membrane secretion channel CsgG
MMQRFFVPLFLLAVLVMGLADAQLKKRIAIARFDDRSGGGYSNLGKGVADMLATALVKSGKFMVIERQELEKVMAEQRLGTSGAVTPETATKVGQILGVEMIVVGSITEFGIKERKISGGISALGGAGLNTKTARAAVDIRLVNTTSGEIVAAETKDGSETTLGVAAQYKKINFSDLSSWNTTDVGIACREAIDGCVELITDKESKVPWTGKILKVNSDGTLMMKPGSEGGVQVGDEYDVFRAGEQIKDPDTGLSLGAEETKIGSLKVKEDALNGKACKATVVSGAFKVGDIVRAK